MLGIAVMGIQCEQEGAKHTACLWSVYESNIQSNIQFQGVVLSFMGVIVLNAELKSTNGILI